MECFMKIGDQQLASKQSFYSNLTDSNILQKEYEHAQNVGNKFKLLTMRFYPTHDMLSRSHGFAPDTIPSMS